MYQRGEQDGVKLCDRLDLKRFRNHEKEIQVALRICKRKEWGMKSVRVGGEEYERGQRRCAKRECSHVPYW